MLIIEDDSVYEIDEECIRNTVVPPECMIYEKLQKKREKEKEKEKEKGAAI